MHNIEIAWALRELADLSEFKGEDFFKVRAYRRAAKTIAGLPEPVAELYKKDLLGKVPGVGKNILAKVGELLDMGSMAKLEEMRSQVPHTLLELMALPGIGPARARLFNERLGVTGLKELEAAAKKKKIRELPGIGGKIEQEILRNLEMLRRQGGHVMLGTARELASELLESINLLPGVERISLVGSMRRWQEMVNDIDILVSSNQPLPVFDLLATHPRVKEVMNRENDWMQVMTWWGISVEMGVVSPEEYWSTLLWSTGSKAHYRRLQLLAWQRGFKLNRHGLFPRDLDRETPLGVDSEAEIYHQLGLSFIPPEIRENTGEISAALNNELPRLVETGDIRGDLHIHTDWSDGVCSVNEIVDRAREKGYSYVAITDHSQSLKVAGGLPLDKLMQQHEEIKYINHELQDFHIFTGVEVDILTNGDLDYMDEVLEQVDVVVASVHSGFRQDRKTITDRIMNAIKNEHVDIIGHPTGRLLGQRKGYDLDVERILEAASKYNKVLEINSSPERMDLNEYHARLARDCGVKLAVNTDAHDLKRMDELPYGVAVARKAWLEPEDIINTLDVGDLKKFLRR